MILHVNDIQKILKKMLVEVVEICDRNNIEYYLVKGGLIGAVKYKSFIPWDPDVDIVIRIKDLQRFCKCVANEIEEPFELCFYTEQPDYEYLFPRIGVKGLDYRQLHLDVFLLAFFPDDAIEQKKIFKAIYLFEALNTLRNSKIRRPVNSIVNRIALITARVLLVWLPRNYVRRKHLELLKTYEEKTSYVIHAGAVEEYKEKYIMPLSWFGDPVRLQFDDILLNCPKDFDSYLRQMYGDYEKDPPFKDQKRQSERIWEFDDEIIMRLLGKNG